MKNAKEIKFERSLDSYKSMNQIKKILKEILTFLKINYEYNIQNLKEELKKIYNIINFI